MTGWRRFVAYCVAGGLAGFVVGCAGAELYFVSTFRKGVAR